MKTKCILMNLMNRDRVIIMRNHKSTWETCLIIYGKKIANMFLAVPLPVTVLLCHYGYRQRRNSSIQSILVKSIRVHLKTGYNYCSESVREKFYVIFHFMKMLWENLSLERYYCDRIKHNRNWMKKSSFSRRQAVQQDGSFPGLVAVYFLHFQWNQFD